MPTYAILGATGNTGRALLTHLLSDSSDQKPSTINAYARSATKLNAQTLSPQTHPAAIIPFTGPLTSTTLLAACLAPPVSTVFVVLGVNENIPGMHIMQDAASSLIAALVLNLKTHGKSYKPPKILFLSSASLNLTMSSIVPRPIKYLINTAFSHAYADLRLAESQLRLHESWLDITFIQPGALTEDLARGYKLSTTRMAEDGPGAAAFVSYADLARGMVEVAERKERGQGEFKWEGVAVVPQGGKEVRFEWAAVEQILRGLCWGVMPWAYWVCRWLGVVS